MTSRATSYNASALDQYTDQLAGQIYLPDEQCEIIDGAGSYLCRVRYVALCSCVALQRIKLIWLTGKDWISINHANMSV